MSDEWLRVYQPLCLLPTAHYSLLVTHHSLLPYRPRQRPRHRDPCRSLRGPFLVLGAGDDFVRRELAADPVVALHIEFLSQRRAAVGDDLAVQHDVDIL